MEKCTGVEGTRTGGGGGGEMYGTRTGGGGGGEMYGSQEREQVEECTRNGL